LSRPNSAIIAGVAAPMTERSMYMMKAITKVTPSTTCRDEVAAAALSSADAAARRGAGESAPVGADGGFTTLSFQATGA
jgi:hypothetical protein